MKPLRIFKRDHFQKSDIDEIVKRHRPKYVFLTRIGSIVLVIFTICIACSHLVSEDFLLLLKINKTGLEDFKLLVELLILIISWSWFAMEFLRKRISDPMENFYKACSLIQENLVSKLISRDGGYYSFRTHEKLNKKQIEDIKNLKIKSNLDLDDILLVHKLAERAWGLQEGLQSTNTYELYRRWHLSNPNVFSLLFNGLDAIGYICILPLADQKHYEQKINKSYIDYNLMNTFSHSSSYIFLENIYVLKNFQNNGYVIKLLYTEAIKKVVDFSKPNTAVKVYATPYYPSLKKCLEANGFTSYISNKDVNESVCQLTLQPEQSQRQDTYIKMSSLNPKAELLINDINKISKRLFTFNDKTNRRTMDKTPFVQDLNEFFSNSFASIDGQEVIGALKGKMYPFYTHAIYKPAKDIQHSTNHYLGISYISFAQDNKSRFISCKFYTGSRENKKAYVYNGVCMFSNLCKDVLMIFNYKQTYSYSTRKFVDDGNISQPPLVISGKIVRDGESTFVSSDLADTVLSLNLTTYSQHYEATVSKIGVLHLKAIDEHKNSLPEDLFEPLDFIKGDSALKKTIKLYLMRSTKVIIKGIDHTVINTKSDIDKWFLQNYQPLKHVLFDDALELYYYKNRENAPPVIAAAYVTFLSNGIAKMERRYSNNCPGREPIIEQYFGEVNIRYNENHKKFLYIKFMQINDTDSEADGRNLSQKFRELFLILFWPEDDYKFDYTRGIILGDRDVDADSEASIMSSNICALCKPNHTWQENISVGTVTKMTKIDMLYDDNRLTNVDKKFLLKVLDAGISEKIQKLELLLKDAEEAANLLKLLSFNELHFDKQKCLYSEIFNPFPTH